ncbi:hypothetical protein [Pedobacter glucosidilyticus]|uniref:hypothetical protein n=1 Tax=Pedobacter glucosidilyticus TaxID=1122941 RepID=UPI00040FAAAB|nr:hypothetical protein [Pedobacter glucosidilyticus]
MESITIEILNPKVKKLLQNLADLNLIAISQNEGASVDHKQWDLLTNEQQESVFNAMESVKSGKGKPHDEVMDKLKKIYK